MPAARFLKELIEEYRSGPQCSACGRSSSDVHAPLKAAIAVLDRTGFGPHATLKLDRPEDASWMKWLTDDEWNVVDRAIGRAKERMAANEPEPSDALALPPYVEDAVCVEDDGVPRDPETFASANVPPARSVTDQDPE